MTDTILDAIGRMHTVATLFPEWQRPQFFGPVTSRDIAALENEIGVAIPETLKRLLLAHRAIVAMDVWSGYWLGANTAGRLQLPDAPGIIIAGDRSTRVVPIATDGGGNAFMACVATLRIWRWNHESGQTYLVAGDLTEFLGLVVEDWTHAANADPDWFYLVDQRRYAAGHA